MVACVQLLVSHSAVKPIFEKCNIGCCSRELFNCRCGGIDSETIIFAIYSNDFFGIFEF